MTSKTRASRQNRLLGLPWTLDPGVENLCGEAWRATWQLVITTQDKAVACQDMSVGCLGCRYIRSRGQTQKLGEATVMAQGAMKSASLLVHSCLRFLPRSKCRVWFSVNIICLSLLLSLSIAYDIFYTKNTF